MVRRLLTLALAGILTLETSMTAYASNQSGVILEEGFGQEEKTSLNTTNKKACDISDDSSDNNINNDSNDNIGDNHDNNSDNEVSDMPDIDTGNDTESGAETETDAGSNTEIGTDTNTETDAESGASTETETKTDADSDASDNDNPDTSGNEEYISNEDEYDTKEFEELEKTEEIEEIEEIEAEAELLDLLQSYDSIIDINYTAALNEGVEIIAPYATSNNKAWYSMTVPEDGQYVFYSENQVLSGTTYIALYSDRYDKNAHKYQYVSTSEYLSVPTWHLKEGEKVYLAIYNSNGEETYKMKVANQTKLTKTSDGIYSYTLPDGNIIEISIVAGYQYFKFDAAMKENPEGGSVLSGT